MRTTLIITVFFVASGCSLLDQVASSSANAVSPGKINIAGTSITTLRHEVDRYTCGSNTMVCTDVGVRLYCSCASMRF